METPTLYKVSLSIPLMDIQKILDQIPFSLRPIAFVFTEKNIEFANDIKNAVQAIEKFILEHKLSLFFPYPIYLVLNPVMIIESIIPTLYDIQNVPKYFKFAGGQLGSRERLVLKKIELLHTKLKYLSINELMESRKTFALKHKLFYERYKQMEFFKKLIWELDLKMKNLTK